MVCLTASNTAHVSAIYVADCDIFFYSCTKPQPDEETSKTAMIQAINCNTCRWSIKELDPRPFGTLLLT